MQNKKSNGNEELNKYITSIEFTRSRKRCMSVMRDSRNSEGEKSHVVFSSTSPKKDKKASFSTFNKLPKKY
jgi:hypothetical protein